MQTDRQWELHNNGEYQINDNDRQWKMTDQGEWQIMVNYIQFGNDRRLVNDRKMEKMSLSIIYSPSLVDTEFASFIYFNLQANYYRICDA